MSKHIGPRIGQIFVEFLIALLAFSLLAGIASASPVDIKMKNHEMLSEFDFSSHSGESFKSDLSKVPLFDNVYREAYLPMSIDDASSQVAENSLRSIVDNSEFMVNRRTQHVYTSMLDMVLRDDNKAWPFLSIEVKPGDLDLKLGSRY